MSGNPASNEQVLSEYEASADATMAALLASGLLDGETGEFNEEIFLAAPRVLSEKHRRRGEIDPDRNTTVIFANGERWSLPNPTIVIHPLITDGVVEGSIKWGSYEELDPLLLAISRSTGIEQIHRVQQLACFLLRRNYDLEDGELSRLVEYRIGDEQSAEMIEGVIDVATGGLSRYFGMGALKDPKPAATGSEPV